MSRYTGPKWRINRRENATVLGVGERWKRRSSAPGQFPLSKKKLSDYAIQFREKQKVKRTYGMTERQFKRFFKLAQKSEGNTGIHFLQLLEQRADNVLYRLGFAHTRQHARQLITHGHVTLNAKKHNIPSTILTPGDELKVKDGMLKSEAYKLALTEWKAAPVPAWLDKLAAGGKVEAPPAREMIDPGIRERLIVELYSK